MKHRVVLSALLVLLLALIVLSLRVYAQGNFTVTEVHWTNRVGGHSIYPGSRGVTYVVTVKYQGSESIEDAVACLVNPPYLTPSDGYSLCAVAETPSHTPATTVNPGDVILFVFHLDVSRDAKPGLYGLTMKVSYRIVSNGESRTEYVPGAVVYISPYPSPSLRVLDVYWEPGCYPGTEDATLHVVLENIGPRINSGYARLEFVNNTVFHPGVLRSRLGPLGERQVVDLTFPRVSVNASASPGSYVAYLKLHLSMETEDGVQYDTYAVLRLNVEVAKPLPVNLTLEDYGFVGLAAPGSRGASIYATLVNREPGVTIEAVYARLVLVAGAEGYNGSRVVFYSTGQRTPYGSSVTLTFRGIDVEGDTVEAVLDTEMLVSRGGAEYWTRRTWHLVIHSRWEPGLRLLGYGWTGPVYPGTAGAEYLVTLGVEGYERVAGGYARLALPDGFQPRELRVSVPAATLGSTLVLRFTGVSVSQGLQPGCYRANLTLSLLLVDQESGARRNATIKLPLLACVERSPGAPLRLVSVWWGGGVAYSNSSGASLVLLLADDRPGVTVENAVVSVVLPPGVSIGGYRVVNRTLSDIPYGGTARLTLDGVSVEGGVEGRLPVAVIVRGLASLDGAEYSFQEVLTGWVYVRRPTFNATLAYYSWTGPVSNGTFGARIRAVLAITSVDRVEELRVEWVPVRGATLLEPGVQVVDVNAGFGSSVAITSPPMLVKSPVVRVELRVYARLARGNMVYTAARSYTLTLYANATIPRPVIEHVEILYNGEPAALAPGERGVTLRLLVYNPTSYTLSSVDARLAAPMMRVEEVGGSCLNGVAPGSMCSLDFTLNVSRYLAPGVYPVLVSVRYTVSQNGYTVSYTAAYTLNLSVVDPSSLAPRLTVVAAYWGAGRPEPVYPRAGLTPLTIVVLNVGRWEARGVTVEAYTGTRGVKPVVDRSVCAATLAPGASCTTTLYYLVGDAKPGTVVFRVRVSQTVYTYGLDYTVATETRIQLEILEPPMGGGVRVVDARWENDWPVYPGTSNAVYQVTLANLEPYQVLGVNLSLRTLPGVHAEPAYIAGPLNPGAEATVGIRVNVSPSARPGCYRAALLITYALRVSGSTGSVVEETPVTMCISNPEESLSVVTIYWAGGATGPGSMGSRLLIVLRNDEVPEMRGIVVKVRLPRGMSYAPTNESIAVVPVTVAPTALQAPGTGQQAGLLARLLSVMTPGAGQQQPGGSAQTAVAAKGSFIVAEVPVNIYSVRPGSYRIGLDVEFIDQWGSRHTVRKEARLVVLGAPRLLEAQLPPVVDVSGGYARVELRITDVGSGPVYSVYVYLVPRIPLLLPQPAVLYIPVLKPGEVKVYNITLYYNPKGLATWGQESGPSYTAVPFTIGFVYSDAAGALHATNYTAVVQVEPFVKLQLGPDTRAEWRNGTLTVGGTVINVGTATAHSVEIRVYAAGRVGYTFLGDLDPGDQTAFRIDVKLPTPVEKVNVTITYLDEYNRVHRVSRILPVHAARLSAPLVGGAPEKGGGLEAGGGLGAAWRYAPLTAAVLAALVFVAARKVRR